MVSCICNCPVLIPDCGKNELPLIVLLGENEDSIRAMSDNMTCAAIIAGLPVDDWNAELTPWPAPPLRRGSEFTGQAGKTLIRLDALVSEIVNYTAKQDITLRARIVMGYSLGGLCALWAATQRQCFDGAASVSGSMWYDGFYEYIKSHKVQAKAVYMSLGDAEPRARNPRLGKVGESTKKVYDELRASGVKAFFEWNSGNHFTDAPLRCAKGADWLCQNV